MLGPITLARMLENQWRQITGEISTSKDTAPAPIFRHTTDGTRGLRFTACRATTACLSLFISLKSNLYDSFRVLDLFVVPLWLCRRQRMPEMRALFGLVDIKLRSFLTSCGFFLDFGSWTLVAVISVFDALYDDVDDDDDDDGHL